MNPKVAPNQPHLPIKTKPDSKQLDTRSVYSKGRLWGDSTQVIGKKIVDRINSFVKKGVDAGLRQSIKSLISSTVIDKAQGSSGTPPKDIYQALLTEMPIRTLPEEVGVLVVTALQELMRQHAELRIQHSPVHSRAAGSFIPPIETVSDTLIKSEAAILRDIEKLHDSLLMAPRNTKIVTDLFQTREPGQNGVKEVLSIIDRQLDSLPPQSEGYKQLMKNKIEFLKVINKLWDDKLGEFGHIPLVDLGVIPTEKVRARGAIYKEGRLRLKPVVEVGSSEVIISGGDTLGFGSFGIVKSTTKGSDIAVKKMNVHRWKEYYDAYREDQIAHEIVSTIPEGQQAYVMEPLGVQFYGDGKHNNLAIFLPKAIGSLYEILPRLDINSRLKFMGDAAKGLAQMHRAGYAHNDWKLANTLIVEDSTKPQNDPDRFLGVVADLGLSVKLDKRTI